MQIVLFLLSASYFFPLMNAFIPVERFFSQTVSNKDLSSTLSSPRSFTTAVRKVSNSQRIFVSPEMHMHDDSVSSTFFCECSDWLAVQGEVIAQKLEKMPLMQKTRELRTWLRYRLEENARSEQQNVDIRRECKNAYDQVIAELSNKQCFDGGDDEFEWFQEANLRQSYDDDDSVPYWSSIYQENYSDTNVPGEHDENYKNWGYDNEPQYEFTDTIIAGKWRSCRPSGDSPTYSNDFFFYADKPPSLESHEI